MSALSLLVMIGRELLPFLKEALLEGLTFRAWLKTNWLTFAWLVNTLFLVLMIAHLTDSLSHAYRTEHERYQQVNNLRPLVEKAASRNKELEAENLRLATEIAELSLYKAENQPKLEKYEEWMQRCGVNLDTGQCKVVRQPARSSPRIKPAPRPQPQPQQEPEPAPEKPGFLQRIRNMLSRDKSKED